MPWLMWIISNVFLASVLALVAWFVQRRLRLPAVARIVWVFVLVKLVTPPLVSVPLVNLPATAACALGDCNCPAHAGSIVDQSLVLPLAAFWSAGAVAMGWLAWRRWAHFQRLMAQAQAAPPEWQSLAARLSSELGVRCPQVLTVPGRLPPLVVPGRPRPRLLLPMALISQLNPSQRVALLLHELSHIKRGDHLVRMLELMVSAAYWWLPVVGAIGRQLRACEEACSDAAVVARLPQARRDYARLLLDVVDFASPLPPRAAPQATAMGAAANDLEQRLHMILHVKNATRRRWLAAALAVSAACAILPCKLTCDFAGLRSSTAATAEQREAASTISLPVADQIVELSSFCCPS